MSFQGELQGLWRPVPEALARACAGTGQAVAARVRIVAPHLTPRQLWRTARQLRWRHVRHGGLLLRRGLHAYRHQLDVSLEWRAASTGGLLGVFILFLLWAGPHLPKGPPPRLATIATPELQKLAEAAEPPDPAAGLHVLARTPEGRVSPQIDGIKILFDHSMVAMTDVDPDKHPTIPLTIQPPIPGEFIWFGTKGVRYRFTDPLPPATQFTVTLPRELQALDGKTLTHDESWTFFTAGPEIVRATPESGMAYLPLRTPIRVTFSLPMQRTGVEQAFRCDQRPSDDPKATPRPCAVKFQFSWETDPKDREVFVATPEQPYAAGVDYVFYLPAGLLPEHGVQGTAKLLSVDASTAGPMQLSTVSIAHPFPANDEIATELYDREQDDAPKGKASKFETRYATGDLCFAFSNPVDRKSFETAVQVVPRGAAKPDPTFRVSYYYEDEVEASDDDRAAAQTPADLPHRTACITADLRFNTAYEVRLARAILDRDGKPADLGKFPQPLRFTTSHAWLEGQLTVTKSLLNARTPPSLPFTSMNAEKVEVTLVPCDRARLAAIFGEGTACHEGDEDEEAEAESTESDDEGDGDAANPRAEKKNPWERTIPIDSEYDVYHHGRIDIAGLYPDLKPGLYEVRATFHPMSEITLKRKRVTLGIEHEALVGSDPVTDFTQVLLTETALALKRFENQFLIWAVDIQNGAPRANLPLQVWNFEQLVATGWTDDQGLFRFLSNTIDPNAELTVIADDPRLISALRTEKDQQGITPADFGYTYQRPWFVKNYYVWFHTDRPLYRPEQTVHFGGFLRGLRDGVYHLPREVDYVDVTIADSNGDEIYAKQLSASANGVFGDSITLGDDAIPRGRYWITARVPTVRWSGEVSTQAFKQAFYVASYRKPDFTVGLTPERAEVVSGEPIKLTAFGRYFFGAPLAHAEIAWAIRREGFRFTAKKYPDFTFVDEEAIQHAIQVRTEAGRVEHDESEYYDGDGDDVLAGVYATDSHDRHDDPKVKIEKGAGPSKTTLTGRVVPGTEAGLDADGLFTIEYTPTLQDDLTSQVYTASMTVKEWGQELTAVADLRIHKAGVYVGLKPARRVYLRGESMPIALVTLDTAGKPIAQQRVTLTLAKRDYMTIKKRTPDGDWVFVSEPKDTVVEETSVTTDAKGEATYTPLAAEGGSYRVTATTADTRGNAMHAGLEVRVGGATDAAWPMHTEDHVDLVPDRAAYHVGDTARILIPFPTEGTRGLLTIERAGIRESRLMEFAPGENVITLPIQEAYVPNVYVGLLLFRPQGAESAVMKVGLTELSVDADAKRVAVDFTPNQSVYAPKDTVRLGIRTTDQAGHGIPADLIVSVADESVLRLLDYQSPDLVRRFYFPRHLGVLTAENMLHYKSGDVGDAGVEQKKRSKFLDTAFFTAQVHTDANGQGTVEFTLPDNITTWVAEAFAITADTKVGSAFTTFRSVLPTFLRPALPRFLAVEDTTNAPIFLENPSKERFSGELSVQTTAPLRLTGAKSWPVVVEPEGRTTVLLGLEGVKPGRGTLMLTTRDAHARPVDVLELPLQVSDRSIPSIYSAVGATRAEAREVFTLDVGARPERGGLEVSIGTTPLKVLRDALQYLFEYPYGCAEQRTSALLGLWQLLDLLPERAEGAASPVLPPLLADLVVQQYKVKKKPVDVAWLQERLHRGLTSLYDFQMADGGFAFWREDGMADPVLSAEMARALALFEAVGVAVDTNQRDKLARYLEDLLSRQKPFVEPKPGKVDRRQFDADGRAQLVWGLAALDAKRAKPALASLLEVRDLMSARGLAALALAMHEMGDAADSGEKKATVKRLRKLAQVTKGERGEQAAWADPARVWDGTTMTAIALEALLTRDNAGEDLVDAAMRAVMSRARGGDFGHTRATREALIALWQYSQSSKTEESGIATTLQIGGRTRTESLAAFSPTAWLHERLSIAELSAEPQPTPLVIRKSADVPGALYYQALLTTYLPMEQVPRREDGIIIAREFYAMDDVREARPLATFTVGQSYKAVLTVMPLTALDQLVVEHLIPAGFEPVDFSLATANPELAAGLRDAVDADIKSPSLVPPDFSHEEIHDDRVMWYARVASAGIYKLRHVVRAATAGTYRAPGATAQPFYDAAYGARSRSLTVTVTPAGSQN
ncbi:MAG: hypothetical protein HY696_02380 [Deltaproteobacteria bacterium]|nr:hypothetical protein [Deltaproteobacteria bacterium]